MKFSTYVCDYFILFTTVFKQQIMCYFDHHTYPLTLRLIFFGIKFLLLKPFCYMILECFTFKQLEQEANKPFILILCKVWFEIWYKWLPHNLAIDSKCYLHRLSKYRLEDETRCSFFCSSLASGMLHSECTVSLSTNGSSWMISIYLLVILCIRNTMQ